MFTYFLTSSYASLLQAIDAVMALALCPLVIFRIGPTTIKNIKKYYFLTGLDYQLFLLPAPSVTT